MTTAARIPVGWQHNPSAWRGRVPAVVLALIGAGIAAYLTLYQLHVFDAVWEPLFGDGSYRILRESAVARWSPVPDAALGVVAYLLEAVAECIGSRERWRTWPLAVFATGALAGLLGLTGIGLVLCQAFVFRAFCTLCLASALVSLTIALSVLPEVWAAWKEQKKGVSHE